MLLDIGIYPLAFATMLGEPEEITGVAHKATTGVDEQSAYLLRHAQGQISILASSLRTQTSMSAWFMALMAIFTCPNSFGGQEMIIQRRNKTAEVVHLPYDGNGYQFEAQEVVDCFARRQNRK